MATHSLFNHANIDKAITALDEYFKKQKESQPDNVLWDKEQDINLVVEPKVNSQKSSKFKSIRIPLVHSFRKDTDNEICIITRSQDVAKWKEVLLTTHPVSNVTKIMGVSEFEKDYGRRDAQVRLVELFDLFLIHPDIVYRVALKLVVLLRNRNKSIGVLPSSYNLLRLGDTKNPLARKKYQKLDPVKQEKYSLKFAKKVAKYRDSTYYMNGHCSHKFIKIGESAMEKEKLKANLINVMNYGLCILPNGGLNNVLRLSLHINNTIIQLPFYVNLDNMSDHYNIINDAVFGKYSKNVDVFLKKRKQMKLKNAMKKNCSTNVKIALINNKDVANLSTLFYVKQCNAFD